VRDVRADITRAAHYPTPADLAHDRHSGRIDAVVKQSVPDALSNLPNLPNTYPQRLGEKRSSKPFALARLFTTQRYAPDLPKVLTPTESPCMRVDNESAPALNRYLDAT